MKELRHYICCGGHVAGQFGSIICPLCVLPTGPGLTNQRIAQLIVVSLEYFTLYIYGSTSSFSKDSFCI